MLIQRLKIKKKLIGPKINKDLMELPAIGNRSSHEQEIPTLKDCCSTT